MAEGLPSQEVVSSREKGSFSGEGGKGRAMKQ